MTCTSTETFNECGYSYPSWYKDDKLILCDNCTFNTGNKTDVLFAQIDDEKAHVYYCAIDDEERPPSQCRSNNFTVQPLRKLECTN